MKGFPELASILRETQAFEEDEIRTSLGALQELRGADQSIGIGIKAVMHSIGQAKQDTANNENTEDAPIRFAEVIDQKINKSRV